MRNCNQKPLKNHLPLIGLLASVCLFAVAAAYYPGGTTFSASSVGYDWTRNFICSLFQPTALNGSANPARFFAIPAMGIFCASQWLVFRSLARKARTQFPGKTIEIAGIGTAVYSFLAVTRMHNLMVTIGLLFFLTGMVALLHELVIERNRLMLAIGLSCLALLLSTAVMYYGNVLYGLLPIAQKLSFVACTGWLYAMYYAKFRDVPDTSTRTLQG